MEEMKFKMKVIFVNATALTSGGGLSTIRQFLENIPVDNDMLYYIFCSDNTLESQYTYTNIKYVYPKYKTGFSRLYWDYFGLKKWSQKNMIKPDLIISMQNTTIRFDNEKIPQISYVMQAIPFVKYVWSFFDRQERTLWFYKNIYPFFMSRFLNENHWIVTQSKWIKYEFAKKFNFPLERIFSIRPFIKLNFTDKKLSLEENIYHIFCPSSAFKYKNNIEIVNALFFLKHNNRLIKDMKIYITINELDDIKFLEKINQCELQQYFVFLGRISYEEMLSYYNSVDLVVFPSYLETFGLPLLEAASFGKPILVANEPYAQEVIGNYKGAILLDIFNSKMWGDAIEVQSKTRILYDKYEAKFEDSWEDFFKLVQDILDKNNE